MDVHISRRLCTSVLCHQCTVHSVGVQARAQSDIAVLTGRLEFKKGQMEDFMLKIHDKTIANCALLKRVETLEVS